MKMLICSDGSEQAERGVRLGAALAASCQAEVTLLGISESGSPDKALLESLQRGQSLLADKKIRAELVTKSGEPIAEIVRRTEEAQYDLVVIGAVRKETRGAFWMSSKSYKIIKEIKPPVLSVAGQSTVIKRVLICSGGKPYIDPAIRLAGQIAQGMGAAATLVHVLPEPPALYAQLPHIEQTASELLESSSELGVNLRRSKTTLEQMGVPTQVRLRHGPVLEEILSELSEGGYELVVTGSALSRSLRTYVLGDISREIVNRARCAVLVARSEPVEPHSRLRRLFERKKSVKSGKPAERSATQ